MSSVLLCVTIIWNKPRRVAVSYKRRFNPPPTRNPQHAANLSESEWQERRRTGAHRTLQLRLQERKSFQCQFLLQEPIDLDSLRHKKSGPSGSETVPDYLRSEVLCRIFDS